MAAWRATGALSHRPYHLALLAEALGKGGDVAGGLRLLGEANELSRATGEDFYGPELHRLRGELLQHDAASEAEACFQAALREAGLRGAKPLELRAALSLGRLYERQGRHSEAWVPLAEVYGRFTEGFDTPDLREAKAVLSG